MSASGRRDRLRRAAAVAVIAAGLVTLSALIPQRHELQGWAADTATMLRAMMFGTRPLSESQVLIVAVGEESLASDRMIGMPRALMTPIWADLAGLAFDHGAERVLFDFIFQYDASQLEIGGQKPLRSHDTPFLKLLREHGREGRMVIARSARVKPGQRFLTVAGSGGIALADLPTGADSAVRRVPMTLQALDGSRLPTLAGRALPDHSEPVFVIPPARLDTLPAVGIAGVLDCQDTGALDALFRGRTVFVGSTLPGEDRIRAADRLMVQTELAPQPMPCGLETPVVRGPRNRTVPGVFLHAGAVDAVLSGWQPRIVPDAARLAGVGAVSVFGAGAAMLLPPAAGAVLAIAGAVAVMAAMAALLEAGWLLLSADPLAATPLAFAMAIATRSRLLDAEQRRLSQQFARYLSPVLVERMRETAPALGGETRTLTIMFADLSGFTALTEHRDSAEVTRILNTYLDLIAREVTAAHGYVDKFVGDAVMAIWNAPAPVPDHAASAVSAAFRIVEAVQVQAAADAAEGLPGFRIKIGINSGPVTVGNIGSRDRLNYTVVGEAVNTAARLESVPKDFDTEIICGPATAEAAREAFDFLLLARMRVAGREEPVSVHMPLGPLGTRERLADPCQRHDDALAAFTAGRFAEAADIWQVLATEDWPGSRPAARLATWAQQFAESPPQDWDGVLTRVGK